jgi:hypothetical protein
VVRVKVMTRQKKMNGKPRGRRALVEAAVVPREAQIDAAEPDAGDEERDGEGVRQSEAIGRPA